MGVLVGILSIHEFTWQWVGLGRLFGGLGLAGSMKIDPATTPHGPHTPPLGVVLLLTRQVEIQEVVIIFKQISNSNGAVVTKIVLRQVLREHVSASKILRRVTQQMQRNRHHQWLKCNRSRTPGNAVPQSPPIQKMAESVRPPQIFCGRKDAVETECGLTVYSYNSS